MENELLPYPGSEHITPNAADKNVQKWDNVKRPRHYNSHPSGVECIEITEHMTFCIGNAIKYLWRCGKKGDEMEDLLKAEYYIQREISRRQRARDGQKAVPAN